MAKICFKINSRVDYFRLLGMMEKTKVIRWVGGGLPFHNHPKRLSSAKYIILGIPRFQISYSNSSEYTHSLSNIIMMIDSQRILSMRIDDKNKFTIYTKSSPENR